MPLMENRDDAAPERLPARYWLGIFAIGFVAACLRGDLRRAYGLGDVLTGVAFLIGLAFLLGAGHAAAQDIEQGFAFRLGQMFQKLRRRIFRNNP